MSSFARAFDYPALAPGWAGPDPMGELPEQEDMAVDDGHAHRIAGLQQEIESMRTAHARQLEHVRRSAREQALRDGAAEHTRNLQAEAERIRRALVAFVEERETYFRDMEHEVVRLALAIAAKVLHREAKMDPLLLSGAVHVALERLVDASGVTMRVPATEAAAWEESLRLYAGAALCPQVVPDINLGPGDCVLHTHVGTVELGVSAQLEEIEKGFFDLLQRRPATRRTAQT